MEGLTRVALSGSKQVLQRMTSSCLPASSSFVYLRVDNMQASMNDLATSQD